MGDAGRYRLVPYPNNPIYLTLTPSMEKLLGITSNYIILAISQAREVAREMEWSCLIQDTTTGEFTHIVTCLGTVRPYKPENISRTEW